MLIRTKNQWLLLFFAAFYSVFAVIIEIFRTDHFMVPFYLGIASFCFLAWATIYTTLSNSILTKRAFLIPIKRFPVWEIESIRPHKKNGKWGYGTVVTIWSKSGQKLTLQPNHPKPFLEMLRQQAPQAEYLL
jgi:hypothetical protein